mmetsp:Transcript_11204/g.41053  ORF Transcript_11204/g.41053 Transcript_11204/m.41053 type:complete len:515 (+) Transcript_11204:77-1621(+)
MANATVKRSFDIVVAASKQLGIGLDGQLPWRLPGDLKFFKDITSHTRQKKALNAVVMGRKTWESIPEKFRPLSDRLNVVLSRTQQESTEQVLYAQSLDEALSLLGNAEYGDKVESVFVIGGGQIYKEAMGSPLCRAVHLTEVNGDFKCDTFLPKIDTDIFKLWGASRMHRDAKSAVNYRFTTYVRKPEPATANQEKENTSGNGDELETSSLATWDYLPGLPLAAQKRHEEYQYLDMIEEILTLGEERVDRTGTGTYSLFGKQMRFDLGRSFPVFTTKRVFWRGVVEELLWFMRGSTNGRELSEKGVGIWDGNGSREYLDSIGLVEREVGDLGPVYGFQWRHFGAEYKDMHADYANEGVDQLAQVIDAIKNKPWDRRIILSAWNPAALPQMALPPCHMFAQFYVANGKLSCQMYQRSADMGLGIPFNVASYSLLTCILAHICNLERGEFIHVIGDAHVYKNHVEPLQTQLLNTPRPFPKLTITAPKETKIEDFKLEDFTLEDYTCHKKIPMKMAV